MELDWISDLDLVLRPHDCRVIENILRVSEIVLPMKRP